jgi:hypothetical protein
MFQKISTKKVDQTKKKDAQNKQPSTHRCAIWVQCGGNGKIFRYIPNFHQ